MKRFILLEQVPSLNTHPVDKIKDKLQNELVFCIKQSYHTFNEICDFQLINFTNLSPYQINPNHIKLGVIFIPTSPNDNTKRMES